MSHIQSHHSGANEGHDTYLVILKIHGESIHLWNQDRNQLLNAKTHSLRIYCRNVETHSEQPASNIQMSIISHSIDDYSDDAEKCQFQDQNPKGERIESYDLITFMTGPVEKSTKASYAIDLSIGSNTDTTINNSMEDLNEEEYERIGTAYVYLDPKFSSQGIQRTPIISTNHVPIGQIQIEYLIVTNPNAHGLKAPRPEWLYTTQMDAGHRGAGSGRRLDLPDELLENTIASFNFAHRNGADMCELDVILSADGIPVVYHDFDVDAVAAQQSRDQLGKFRVQVNEFTLKQMRDFRLLSLHDEEGCPYTLNVKNQAESNRPFPTLAEVLDQVDETCGLNIELKWPQLLESGKMEARKYCEINDFVDKIIDVIELHSRDRKIVLESFDADLVILLRLKQNKFPVVFLNQGMTDCYERYMDIRARSVKSAVYFAHAFDLAGIDLILDYFVMSGKKLVNFINDHNLVARAWGDISDDIGKIAFLKEIGIQCVTYDKIDLVKQSASHSNMKNHKTF